MMLIIIYIGSYVSSFSNDQKNRFLQENLILQVENIFSIQKQFIDSKNNSLLHQIDSLKIEYKDEFSKLTNNYKEIHQTYLKIDALFTHIVQLYEIRGLTENTGLEGQFRKKAHALESAFYKNKNYELQILLLQLRRNEKDYLLRKRNKYLESVDSISKLIKNKSKNQFEKELILNYVTNFKKLVSVRDSIQQLIEEHQSEIIKSRKLFKDSSIKLMQEVEYAEIKLKWVIGLSIVGIALAFIFIYYSIHKQITFFSDKAYEISKGNFKGNITYSLKNEFGLLATAFNKMQHDLNKSYVALEKKAIEAEESAKIKSRFIANMSHEIKTPMNAIIGFSELLGKTSLNNIQKSYIQTILFSGQHLIGLLSNILDYSKLEAGKTSVIEESFDLNELIDQLTQMLEYKAINKKIYFKKNIHSNPSYYLISDPVKWSQILINLLDNAIKFTSSGGVSLTCFIENSSVIFTIEDTGIGINAEKINDIFKEFTQEETDTTRRFGGTGLGLSITKKLIELLSGSIQINSVKNQGTIFKIQLPFKKGALKNAINSTQNFHENISTLENKNILVVDDDIVNQMLAENIFKRFKINYHKSFDGREALEKLAINQKFDCILMDYHMPQLDGYDTTKAIRAQASAYFKNVPIIALTANNDEIVRKKMFDAGANDFIQKPLKIEQLIQIISTIIQQNQIEEFQ